MLLLAFLMFFLVELLRNCLKQCDKRTHVIVNVSQSLFYVVEKLQIQETIYEVCSFILHRYYFAVICVMKVFFLRIISRIYC